MAATVRRPSRTRLLRRGLSVLLVLLVVTIAAATAVVLEDELARDGRQPLARSETTAPTTRPEPLVSGRPEAVTTTDPATLQTSTTETTATTGPAPSAIPTAAAPSLGIDPVFDSIHDRLANTLEIPVRLPSRLDEQALGWSPTLSSVDANGYVVHLGIGESCNGASSCRVSTFTARKSNRLRPRIPGDGTPVPLPNDLLGVFSDSTCGSDCTNGFITWAEGNVLYSVGSRLASGPEVLQLTWNSIDSTVTSPVPPEICGPGAPADLGRVARPITTNIEDGRSIHWLLVCSADGTSVEILRQTGQVRWADIDADGFRDLVLRTEEGQSVIFAVGTNAPRAAIDVGTSSRLVVGELGCADLDDDGQPEAYDLASNERLEFVNPVTVRRSAVLPEELVSVGHC